MKRSILFLGLMPVLSALSSCGQGPSPAAPPSDIIPQSQTATPSFLFGAFNVIGGEEAIVTYGLPTGFNGRFVVSASDPINTAAGNIRLFGATAPSGTIRFQSGASTLVDANSVILRVPGSPNADFNGSWSMIGDKLRDIPFQQYQSLINPFQSTANMLVEVDEPSYFVISYFSMGLPVGSCSKSPVRFTVDGKNIADETGQTHPTYPGNSILTYGQSISVMPTNLDPATCNIGGGSSGRFKFLVKVAKKADVELALSP